MTRTAKQILDETNDLARQFYSVLGYEVGEGYQFQYATHPHEEKCWKMACIAQEALTDTEPDTAVDEVEFG